MTDLALSYGSFVYGAATGVIVEKAGRPEGIKSREADTPGRHGGYSAGGLLAARKFPISGIIVGTSASDTRDKIEAFTAAHAPGSTNPFYYYDDRYINAEVSGISNMEYDGTAMIHVPFDVEFAAIADPWLYDVTINTTTGLAAGGTVTTGGTAPAAPIWTMVVSSFGTNGSITLNNTTTGEILVFAPTLTGTYLINNLLETLTRSGTDYSANMQGVIPGLAVGGNVITISLGGSATLSALSVSWQDRYW